MRYLAVDSGTTHTRIWLLQRQTVCRKVEVPVGVRNTAIDGNNQALAQGIFQKIRELQDELPPSEKPQFAVAAGMITSNLGLHEVKHVSAPAGVEELSQKMETQTFGGLEDLPFYFIPGVRSGPPQATLENAHQIDMLRGEETEVLGALYSYSLAAPLLYVHLGSHTKLVVIDSDRRICGGISTLAGELSSATSQYTILRDSLPSDSSLSADPTAWQKGWEAARTYGFTRALYLVRVLQLNSSLSKRSLAAFLAGAVISADFHCLESMLSRHSFREIVLSGLPDLQPAWLHFLRGQAFPVRSLTAEETAQAFLRGVFEIAVRRTLLCH